jgi:hypothetical protein
MQNLHQRPSIVVESFELDSGGDNQSAKSSGQDSALGIGPNTLGLLLDNSYRLRDQGRTGHSDRISTRLGVGSDKTRLSPVFRLAPINRLALSNLSSQSSNLDQWPPSPLAHKGNRFSSSGAGKRKRLLSERDDGVRVDSAEKVDTKRPRWIPPVVQSVADDEDHHHDTSPDYRMMLNLSDTPSQADEPSADPFTYSNVAQRGANDFHLSVSRDASLSPTIKNPSIGSLDSEDLSIACLVRDTPRSPSYGLVACSGFTEDQEECYAELSREVEKRRLDDVMERWGKSRTSANTSTIELYRAPEPPAHRSLILAPPRPLDRNTLVQYTRALEERNRYNGAEPSLGLLDIVCENEALMRKWNTGMEWSSGSLAPRDMHIRPKQDPAQDVAKARYAEFGQEQETVVVTKLYVCFCHDI